ncbi:MAG: hypothetical protein ACD_38C00153G0002 [uncultured bacterium]|uniref:Uncharacterized protein n=1 Tax=Candidatus Daviesbacteria bacterium GW2011_GWC2_40_12 TaxID=1618431 RepID=A0A0G0QY61_9BACT|nr:MAG: hypothetical protein ACD_38C00153G0002 [uncultured bacterium]KKQ85498.1 MAG: hypothetical protein UT04_C0003G0003 [Candidatus Daviesbacteria bacterium GW2011_GWF2_38_7]KKR16822.1 MAG: hypothetical protein UT45_C0004G0153 [Candidatus Daviesbacteria bacterium GW2011_GWA2_39_33]KKR24465.1 MAG: hypothetical protein UT54_C0019G0008 [Candidatus Daviesbacteria bacterium GW2011_GWB1_39_5]KKR42396.1 MAG: hypothetical protein UT77_C0002G0049 [Candidatus Daviesbacteria bacterium GW2011_GWC2_40_12]
MKSKVEGCGYFQQGLCRYPLNQWNPDDKPSLAVVNQKARRRLYPSNILPYKCTARIGNGAGLTDKPDVVRQASCKRPTRVR